ncbi:saccharopine dehydrogenase C-terminal domain-containing protein [Pseudomonas sp. BW7P1]|uniref:saccharopine dehydrogenase C-terminal domain-containing protein n=1 Tax=Pseudomonas TaxID=286 RepID=UPI0021AD5BCD|nr:saccharopine dehydrogenase C-terminal domain-containing protein [Pseudomonas sp. BW7P1]UWI60083.1 NAD(P)-binding domain-containing protein [Pseudomonas sp. BW7P1]
MSKNIGLIGCGNLGYPLALHIGQLGFDRLYVHDLDERKATRLKRDLEQAHPALQVMDHLDTAELDVVLLALSGPATIAFVTDERNDALFRKRPVYVSLGRPLYDDFTAHQALHRRLLERDVTLFFGFGLEPGLVEILMHDLASNSAAGTIVSLSAVCGGVPQQPQPPLNYDLLFGDRLPALNRKALVKIDGSLGYCLRFDMKESRFVEGVGMLDVYHDGLSPYLLESPGVAAVATIRQQTARWPGFFDSVRNLIDLGLLDEHVPPGASVSASDQVHDILVRNGRLSRNRPDISFVEVVAQLACGEQATHRIVSTFDEANGLTGMAQLTSFLAVWSAWRAVQTPDICRPGIILSHECYERDATDELLAAYRRYVKCTVNSSPLSRGVPL